MSKHERFSDLWFLDKKIENHRKLCKTYLFQVCMNIFIGILCLALIIKGDGNNVGISIALGGMIFLLIFNYQAWTFEKYDLHLLLREREFLERLKTHNCLDSEMKLFE